MVERYDYGNDLALMLTASIDIKGMPEVARPQPQQRQDDYAIALSYWLSHQPMLRRIIFVENSGWPLDELRRHVDANNPLAKEVEFISLNCNEFPRKHGKGYGEFLMMDQAMERSQMARDSKAVLKLTGRAIVRNLDQILGRIRKRFDLLCDLRDHPIYDLLHIKAPGHWCDARLFGFTLPVYDRYLRGKYDQFIWQSDTPYLPENLLFETAKEMQRAVKPDGTNEYVVVPRFPIEPAFVGSPAHWTKSYDSPRERAKRATRGALRFVAPWLYI
jgi:hypothetical protein